MEERKQGEILFEAEKLLIELQGDLSVNDSGKPEPVFERLSLELKRI